jgi:hypothetical protein
MLVQAARSWGWVCVKNPLREDFQGVAEDFERGGLAGDGIEGVRASYRGKVLPGGVRRGRKA